MHDTLDISVSLLDTSRAPLTGLLGEHESHFFSTGVAINPLVAAASPLISIATGVVECQDPATLQDEVRAFEHHAHKQGFPVQVILAARYLLCTFIDETHGNNLLTHFQHENWGGERFFIILERSCENPQQYIDLLELGYLCLSLGFQGKFKRMGDLNQLGRFMDHLYQVIRHQRGEHAQRLLGAEPQLPPARWRLPPWWITLGASLVVLVGLFLPYHYHLSASIQPLVTQLNQYDANP